MEVDVSLSVPLEVVEVGVATKIKHGFKFGNSKSSKEEHAKRTQNMVHSFSSTAELTRYTISWDETVGRKYTKAFIDALRGLCSLQEEDYASVYKKFIHPYGTHVFDTVTLGTRATYTTYGS